MTSLDDRTSQAAYYLERLFGEQPGIAVIGIGSGGSWSTSYRYERWTHRYYQWPDDRDRLIRSSLTTSEHSDVFIAQMLRSSKERGAHNCLPGAFLWADIDEDVEGASELVTHYLPNAMMVSSGRGLHVYVPVGARLEPADIAAYNQRLAVWLGADSKFNQDTVLRLPGTYNHKEAARGGDLLPVLRLTDAGVTSLTYLDQWLAPSVAAPSPVKAKQVNASVKMAIPKPPANLHPRVLKALTNASEDRSDVAYHVVCTAKEAGYALAETLAITYHRCSAAVEKYGDRLQDWLTSTYEYHEVEFAARDVDLALLALPYSVDESVGVTAERLLRQIAWRPFTGDVEDRFVLVEHIKTARDRGSFVYGLSEREAAERALVDRKTARYSAERLGTSRWFEVDLHHEETDDPRLAHRYRLLLDNLDQEATWSAASPVMTATEISQYAADVFRRGGGGLGAGAHAVFVHLLNHGSSTVRDLITFVGGADETNRARLRKLEGSGLAHRDRGHWSAIVIDDLDWRLLAGSLGVAGRSQEQRLGHEIDRLGGNRSQNLTVALAKRRLEKKSRQPHQPVEPHLVVTASSGVAGTGMH